MKGKLYIMASSGWADGYLKIGKTARDSNARAAEIDTTGVPERIMVIFEQTVNDIDAAESWVHKQLDQKRVRKTREFFVVEVDQAISVLKEAAEKYKEADTSEFTIVENVVETLFTKKLSSLDDSSISDIVSDSFNRFEEQLTDDIAEVYDYHVRVDAEFLNTRKSTDDLTVTEWTVYREGVQKRACKNHTSCLHFLFYHNFDYFFGALEAPDRAFLRDCEGEDFLRTIFDLYCRRHYISNLSDRFESVLLLIRHRYFGEGGMEFFDDESKLQKLHKLYDHSGISPNPFASYYGDVNRWLEFVDIFFENNMARNKEIEGYDYSFFIGLWLSKRNPDYMELCRNKGFFLHLFCSEILGSEVDIIPSLEKLEREI